MEIKSPQKISKYIEQGQYSHTSYDSPRKIDIFRSPIKRIRKKEVEKNDRFDISSRIVTTSNGEANTPRKSIPLSIYKARARGYSQKIRQHKDLTAFIIRDLEEKDEISENPPIFNKNTFRGISYKSNKSSNRFNFYKKNKLKRKKVHFRKQFVDVIEVENYKRYNINEYLYFDYADAKCSCLVY